MAHDKVNLRPASRPELIEYVFSNGQKDLLANAVAGGGSISVKWNVLNVGFAHTGRMTVRFYLSRDRYIRSSDTLIGTISLPGLAANVWFPGLDTFTIPANQPAGTYYVGYTFGGTVPEYTIEDNVVLIDERLTVRLPVRPDLVVPSRWVSDNTLTPGQVFSLRATVRNQGAGVAPATRMRFYRSTNSLISKSDLQVGSAPIAGLPHGGTDTRTVSVNAPSSPGTYYYGACVDVPPGGESNENNNCSTGARVTVTDATVDLVVESPAVSHNTLTAGQTFTFSATVRNQGGGTSAVTTLRYYRSTDAAISTSDTVAGTSTTIDNLLAGGTQRAQVGLTAPSTAGTYYYGACVDAVTGETVTGNNCSTGVAVTVSGGLEPGTRDPDKDVDALLDAGNTGPVGIWSDGATMWVVDWEDVKLYAYTLSTGTRDAARDVNALTAAGNTEPADIWSDGTTMWVSDRLDAKLYAYTLSTGTRDAAKDIDVQETYWAAGIWSDGTTMWVADWTADENARLYAYTLSTGARDAARDFDSLAAAGNTDPYGIWSDGATMWVADFEDDQLYAYTLSTRNRDATRDFNSLAAAGNDWAYGIWSDGTTMWVSDDGNDKLYAYHLGAWRTVVGLTPDQYERYRNTWTATTTPATLTGGDARMPGPAPFADHPLGPGTTTVRAIHFRELRTRIAALRVREDLPAVRWTDPVLTPGVTPVRRVHLTELRAALDAVYDAAGSPRPHYTDAVVVAGATAVKAEHLLELRAAVAALEPRR